MRVYFDNVNVNSSSGPNSFGRKLIEEFRRRGHDVSTNPVFSDRQLSFIQTNVRASEKIALRLDGIYFNTRQDWDALNAPIKASCTSADLVIYQSQFNKRLTEKYFGPAKKHTVIGNGTDLNDIARIPVLTHAQLDKYEEVWCCSSSWRPHKRLKDNIEYFHQMKPNNSALLVLGENPDYLKEYSDVFYLGKQSWETCISIYKRCKKFIHLAFLDHCPNVVVDARAAGCDVIVSSSGGTKEIAGLNATIVQDVEWDLRPLDLYSPPPLDYARSFKNDIDSDIDIRSVASRYIDCLEVL